jgi:Zn-dependent M16 (insulinase) family peptidase
LIKTTYQTITPESSEDGDYADHGWEDEDGESMIPDDYDIDEGITAIDKAVKFLNNKGATEPSSSEYHQGLSYSTPDPDRNYTTGEETYYSYHLSGFTPNEEYEIWKKITNWEQSKIARTMRKYNVSL